LRISFAFIECHSSGFSAIRYAPGPVITQAFLQKSKYQWLSIQTLSSKGSPLI